MSVSKHAAKHVILVIVVIVVVVVVVVVGAPVILGRVPIPSRRMPQGVLDVELVVVRH
jgi:hypothetical protein